MKSRADSEKKKRKRDFSVYSQKRHSQRQWLEREGAEGAFLVLEGYLCDYGKQAGAVWERKEYYCGWLGDMEKRCQWRKRFEIIVAIDESDGSFYALNWALDNLVDRTVPTVEPSQEESALVTLVHVQQPFQHHMHPAGPAAFYASSSIIESVRKSQAENATALLSRASQMDQSRNSYS
ncbi:hypothetical protein SADUNF_Sadunf06G0154900 [Salix dunnii]|uniref:UspA domain-containing protein n=1 Tax=Salix dunnii TaxID=1413687 RepID=A0A835K4L4_9ROSI|nr:hypothetical protein SADUNF_Sadunf06G0154900 [Salix dunnii]